MSKKVVVAKICDDGRQKRLTVPKQKETKEWEHGDLIKMERVEIE